MRRLILGTAGHIDHGKTALVKALTGVDTDRLKEEKERGITVDLGFAEYQAYRMTCSSAWWMYRAMRALFETCWPGLPGWISSSWS